MINPIEKFKVAILHLNRIGNHCATSLSHLTLSLLYGEANFLFKGRSIFGVRILKIRSKFRFRWVVGACVTRTWHLKSYNHLSVLWSCIKLRSPYKCYVGLTMLSRVGQKRVLQEET